MYTNLLTSMNVEAKEEGQVGDCSGHDDHSADHTLQAAAEVVLGHEAPWADLPDLVQGDFVVIVWP